MNHSTENKDLWSEIRRTLQLAAPVMIGMVASFAMNFIDTVMSARLPEKEVALAALATGGALWSGMLMITIGILMAVQPAVAQLDGARRYGQAGAVTRQGFWLAAALAIPYVIYLNLSPQILDLLKVDPAIIPVAVVYLKALSWGAPMICLMLLLRFYSEGSGHTRPTMYIGVLGALLNIPFNWVLMFGHLGFPALGARGCGYATSIVITLQTLALIVYVKTHDHYREFRLFERWDGPDWVEIRQLLKVGLPIAGTLFVEGSLFMAAALLIGRLGPIPAASHLVAINYSALVFMVPLGLASAVTTRVGNALGRGEPAAARHAGMIGLGIVTCTQALSAAVMLLFPELIVSIYTREPAIVSLAAGLLFYAAIFQLSDGIQICSAACLRGYKDTLAPMWINVISFWLIGMTLGYHLTFSREMGPAGMWIGMIAGLTFAAVLLTSRFLWRSRLSAAPAPGL